MSHQAGPGAKLLHASAAIAFAFVAISCGDAVGKRAAPEAPATAQVRSAATSAPVCQATGAHTAHSTIARGCATCHPCGGAYGFPPDFTLPSGRPVNGTITRDPVNGTTCSVACHTPVGATDPTLVSWSATGPLACSSCHAQGSVLPPTSGSSHPMDTSSAQANRDACQSCHDLSAHISGSPRIKTGTGVIVVPPGGTVEANVVCENCHLGSGTVIAGQTPPKIVGWADATNGDFHGARAGTGSGGTLAAPYVRGQDPIACTACHDAHQSNNKYLFTGTANGQAVPPGTITHAGVGAEGLCTGCHQGNRHQYCIGCHGLDPEPAGAPCLYCHGHEGIVNFPWPTTPSHGGTGPPPGSGGDCWHCHNPGWAPYAEYVPPVISAIAVTDLTPTSATVTWTTNEKATSFVEYGRDVIATTAGDRALATSHRVVVTGLSSLTTYQFRVRSADGCRNASVSTTSTFTTADASAPVAPVLNTVASFYSVNTVEPVTMTWQPVTSPVGNPVQYQVQITAPSAPAIVSPWLDAPQWATTLDVLFWPDVYTWKVMARDKVTGSTSPWSNASSFSIWSYY